MVLAFVLGSAADGNVVFVDTERGVLSSDHGNKKIRARVRVRGIGLEKEKGTGPRTQKKKG